MSRLGPYTLLERLGRGGMGEVHIARRDGSTTLCVLKQLRERAEGDQLFRLKREAHVLSQLTHPNIGRLIDAGVDGDTFYLALELIPGQTVRRILKRLADTQRRFPIDVAIQASLEVLDGLAYAHDQKDPEGRQLELVHRDLSPNNVMLSYEGRTKIIDFGIASVKLDDFRTMPGTILGTMRYISPEQALSKPVDKRSDIYTLGVVLYEMLSGVPVVEKGGQAEILDAVLRKKPEPLPQLMPDLPPRIWPVIAKAIEKRVQDRFESAQSFKAALVEACRGMPLPSDVEIGSFLSEVLPQDGDRAGKLIAPDEDTRSVEGANTDKSEASVTASDEQPTLVERGFSPVELRLPPEPVPPATPRQKKISLGMPLAVIATLSATTALVLAMQEQPAPNPPAPAVSVRISPSVKVVPKETPPPEPAPARVVTQPRRRPKPRVMEREPLQSNLRSRLAALRSSPDDVRLMVELHREIERSAYSLPDSVRDEIRAVTDAALRANDVDGMERGLQLLETRLSE